LYCNFTTTCEGTTYTHDFYLNSHPHTFTPFLLARPSVQINADGAAATDGRLKVGDKLLVCNGKNLSGVTHQEARRWLVNHLDDLRLTISRRRDDDSDLNSDA
jgi:hypothetical protein